MKVLVIGGTGKIGSYLVPHLVRNGHEVISMSRGNQTPYHSSSCWKKVRQVAIDRKAAEKSGTFGLAVAGIEAEVIIDLLCYKPEEAERVLEAVRGKIHQLIVCGTISVYGASHQPPTTESMPRDPISEYGENKRNLEAYLLDEARVHGVPVSILHPGHVVGSGWLPVNPQGNFNPAIFEQLATGQEILLPGAGLQTLHHVHASDVAQAFLKVIDHWSGSCGESFNITSPAAVTLSYYAKCVARWFDQQANIGYRPYQEWITHLSDEDRQMSEDHLLRSPCLSIDKARKVLDYQPVYDSLSALEESLTWWMEHRHIAEPV